MVKEVKPIDMYNTGSNFIDVPTRIETPKISKKIKWNVLPCNPSGNCVCPPERKQKIFEYGVSIISTGEYLFCNCKMVLFMTCTSTVHSSQKFDVIFTLKISHSLERLGRWTSFFLLDYLLKVCLQPYTASDRIRIWNLHLVTRNLDRGLSVYQTLC